MKTIRYISIILMFFTCNIFAKENVPEWLTNPKTKYPESRYLTAIGEGDTRKTAERNAAANLALIFESSIKVDETLNTKHIEFQNQQKQNFSQNEAEFSKNIVIGTSQTLFNIQYGESYINPTGRNYVLAYINRIETASIVEEQIEENTKKILSYLKKSKINYDPISKYACLNAALITGKANEPLLKTLKVIDSKFDHTTDYRLEQISQETSMAAKNIKFGILVNEEDDIIRTAIFELLSNSGFIIGEPSTFAIEGKISFEDIDLQRKETFLRWRIMLILKDSQNNTLFSFSDTGREGHINYVEAKSRCIRSINEKIMKKFKNQLDRFFLNFIKL